MSKIDENKFLVELQAHYAEVPFFQFLGARLVRLAHGEADVQIKMRPEYANTYGIGHGGVVAALVDMATGVALRTMQIFLVTIETSTNYFGKAALDTELTAYARMVYLGKRIANGSVEVRNSEGALVATGKSTFYVTGDARKKASGAQEQMAELYAFSRTELLLGAAAMEKLAGSRVAVFGIGGVGSFTVEALARAGVGGLTLIDDDCICLTNLNRQLHATMRTVGWVKVEAMRERVLEINPCCAVSLLQKFYLPENAEEFFVEKYDYVVDAIDTVTAKIDLIVRTKDKAIPVISCMGTGNKLDPTRFEVADIYKTSMCPLAKVMRYELRARGVKDLKVVYSREQPLTPMATTEPVPTGSLRRQTPGSISFVPSVAGLILAGEVIKDLIDWQAEA